MSELHDLLGENAVYEVLPHDHPEFRWYVALDDEVAHAHSDLVDAMIGALQGRPDVVRAVREDREVVLVGGAIDRTPLESWLETWWRDRADELSD